MSNIIAMDDIMQASFGEVANELTVTFKKTVLQRQYETEVIESTSKVKLDNTLTGIERMFVTALIEVQLEYTTYVSLAAKGVITQSKLAERKQMLEEGLYSIKYKADQILGEGVIDKYINYNNLDK
jgi:hypothetical protein